MLSFIMAFSGASSQAMSQNEVPEPREFEYKQGLSSSEYSSDSDSNSGEEADYEEDSDPNSMQILEILIDIIFPLADGRLPIQDLAAARDAMKSKYGISDFNEVANRNGNSYDRILQWIAEERIAGWVMTPKELLHALRDCFGYKPTPGVLPNAEEVIAKVESGEYDVIQARLTEERNAKLDAVLEQTKAFFGVKD